MPITKSEIKGLVDVIGEAVGEELQRLESQIKEDRKQIRELKDTIAVLKMTKADRDKR